MQPTCHVDRYLTYGADGHASSLEGSLLNSCTAKIYACPDNFWGYRLPSCQATTTFCGNYGNTYKK